MQIDYREVAKKVLAENGQYLYGTLDDEPIDIDSVTFISIVVGIENELGINVSDTLLTEYPNTYNEYVSFIEKAVELSADGGNEVETMKATLMI